MLVLTLISLNILTAQHIGVKRSDGSIDTVQLNHTVFPLIICQGECLEFVYLDIIPNPNFTYIDSVSWTVNKGNPHISYTKNTTICFDTLFTSDILNPQPNSEGIYLQQFGILDDNGKKTLTSIGQVLWHYNVIQCPPVANFTLSNDLICEGESVYYSDSSKYFPEKWEWKFEGGIPNFFTGKVPPPIRYDYAGEFYSELKVSNSQGEDTIIKKQIIEVKARPVPNPNFVSDFTGKLGTQVTLMPCYFGEFYKWIPQKDISCSDCDSPIITFGETSNYLVIISSDNGFCEDSCRISLTTEFESPNIFFPNIITPNYDGVNDVFEGNWIYIDPIELNIFDRWGGVKFSSKTNFKWDGTYNGQEVTPGVYVYYFIFKNKFTGLDEVKSGSVTILK